MSSDLNFAGAVVLVSFWSRALRLMRALLTPLRADANALAQCQDRVENELSTRLEDVDALIRSGRRGEARDAFVAIDARYSGFAAPRIMELMDALNLSR